MILGSGNVPMSDIFKRQLNKKLGIVPLGKLLYCAYCRSKFYQQGAIVHYDNEGKQYLQCPYCNDHKIYTGVVRKK